MLVPEPHLSQEIYGVIHNFEKNAACRSGLMDAAPSGKCPVKKVPDFNQRVFKGLHQECAPPVDVLDGNLKSSPSQFLKRLDS